MLAPTAFPTLVRAATAFPPPSSPTAPTAMADKSLFLSTGRNPVSRYVLSARGTHWDQYSHQPPARESRARISPPDAVRPFGQPVGFSMLPYNQDLVEVWEKRDCRTVVPDVSLYIRLQSVYSIAQQWYILSILCLAFNLEIQTSTYTPNVPGFVITSAVNVLGTDPGWFAYLRDAHIDIPLPASDLQIGSPSSSTDTRRSPLPSSQMCPAGYGAENLHMGTRSSCRVLLSTIRPNSR